jgi:hypothetical protein
MVKETRNNHAGNPSHAPILIIEYFVVKKIGIISPDSPDSSATRLREDEDFRSRITALAGKLEKEKNEYLFNYA